MASRALVTRFMSICCTEPASARTIPAGVPSVVRISMFAGIRWRSISLCSAITSRRSSGSRRSSAWRLNPRSCETTFAPCWAALAMSARLSRSSVNSSGSAVVTRSALARTTDRMLLKSCAIPPVSCPTASSFCACRNCCSRWRCCCSARSRSAISCLSRSMTAVSSVVRFITRWSSSSRDRRSSSSRRLRSVMSSQVVTIPIGSSAEFFTTSDSSWTAKVVPSFRTLTLSRRQLPIDCICWMVSGVRCSAGVNTPTSRPSSSASAYPCMRASAGLV